MSEKDLNEEIKEGSEEETKETVSEEEKTEEKSEAKEESKDKEKEEAKENEASQEEKSEKKKPFGKKDKKKDKAAEKIEELEDKVKRQLAEFENFRNRTEKEKTAMYETGAKSVIEKILPVIDNFERGLQAVPEDQKDDPFVDGMNKIYKQMMTELEGIGVEAIDAVGNDFDPELHNAVMQVESDEYESGVVAQEMQKGYTYRGSVVRHSMVAVVQ
ncbi:MAG TPA: nucleotide exchange factor GrpE [Lachnospiraceae bacterium]|nr:nucleotide exchange factor GrpE [Lachnospiraceae bacterium]